MGLDRAPIEFQTFYFSHVWLVPPIVQHYNQETWLCVSFDCLLLQLHLLHNLLLRLLDDFPLLLIGTDADGMCSGKFPFQLAFP